MAPPPKPLSAREQTLVELVATFGHENARRVIADYRQVFTDGSPVIRDLEIYASMHRPAAFGELGQRTEGRREMIFHIRAVLALSPDDVAAVPQRAGEPEDEGIDEL